MFKYKKLQILFLLSSLLFSCQKEAKIELLEVDSGLPHKKVAEEPQPEPGQMAKLDERVNLIMGVVIPTANRQWFIKIASPFDEFEKVKPMFEKMKSSIKFDDYSVEVVSMDLADGWVMQREKGFIHSSITHPNMVTKITISSAKGSLLENVNRWNNQLGMAPINEMQLTQIVSKVNMNGLFGLVVILFKRPQEPLTSTETPLQNPHNSDTPKMAPAKAIRMAFGVAKEASWYIKMSGEANTLILQKNNFEAFLKSFKFAEDEPTWEIPAGWEKTTLAAMSMATFKVADAVVTVTPLGEQSGSVDSNVNRWRRQIGLPEASPEEINKALQKVTVGGNEFNYIFISKNQEVANPADEVVVPKLAVPPVPQVAKGSQERINDDGITYTRPVNWEHLKPTSMRKVNLKASGLEVTGIFLGAAAKGVEKNVERWCQQIGMQNPSKEELAKLVQPIHFNGKENNGSYIVLDSGKMAILAVIHEFEDGAWFFKVMGDSATIAKEKNNFEAFIESIRFSEGQ